MEYIRISTDSGLALSVVKCEICGEDTVMDGTKRCNRCWELEYRILEDPDLARKILAVMEG